MFFGRSKRKSRAIHKGVAGEFSDGKWTWQWPETGQKISCLLTDALLSFAGSIAAEFEHSWDACLDPPIHAAATVATFSTEDATGLSIMGQPEGLLAEWVPRQDYHACGRWFHGHLRCMFWDIAQMACIMTHCGANFCRTSDGVGVSLTGFCFHKDWKLPRAWDLILEREQGRTIRSRVQALKELVLKASALGGPCYTRFQDFGGKDHIGVTHLVW
ncbi:hypothetical protein NC653_022242 [Populus alba x Populus x berolinensis]|uniref:Uncharacterized protein n=1 Tax=Populus alba x Populus x berolinensis TaxID=444605 RepID=A0AAD6ME94_9ROSI|nr:hypothetical protein NC653_022242 [Populus alba x Populus x berolinensis]